MKHTIFVTQACNLDCSYCYVKKNPVSISKRVYSKVIDFIFSMTPPEESIEIGLFGGEPLLEPILIKEIVLAVKQHREFSDRKVDFILVSNGTLFDDDIVEFLQVHNIGFGISCDGDPKVQNMARRFVGGDETGDVVESNINKALENLPAVMVNAVLTPENIDFLPESMRYFLSVGVRQIYVSPDYSANWTQCHAERLDDIFRQVGEVYINAYEAGNPFFVSVIDSKLTVILRGGYRSLERCRMGKGEFAYTPSGNIYPCERLVGADDGKEHCIGHVNTGLDLDTTCRKTSPGSSVNESCLSCRLNKYCMNWCGCSNYFSSGYYNRVGAFLCAFEKQSIKVAYDVFQTLEKSVGPFAFEHLNGIPSSFSVLSSMENRNLLLNQ